ncbi:adenosylcobinamide-phosphate synthase CbiB [Arenicella xantha]|uniref:adenosylcobinamide-phosphate synthase CbiB n=1 Tax=Arenicella xantha TaxID=644221 RepID=UPI001B86585F|nr:adenosylcobinamide-phosphate synthase CbiB [Arenicella xantha]
MTTILALLLDQWLGEPRRWHPLVGFGRAAYYLEKIFNRSGSAHRQFINGIFCLLILLVPAVALIAFIQHKLVVYSLTITVLFDIVVLYWAIGLKSLTQHVQQVEANLSTGQLSSARQALALIVSRDTSQLEATDIAAGAIETTLENGCDAVFGALFWYLIAGAPGVIAYRLINTLDAMWGYRTKRYEWFGKSAAVLDDIANYVPARLTALSYALCGNTKLAIISWRRFAAKLDSPNAGPVMCAGAGSLNLKLGGDAVYQGQLKTKIEFGGDRPPHHSDISASIGLLNRAVCAVCLLLVVISIGLPIINSGLAQ